MQSKGAIKFFAIAFAIVCIFQLSFTYVAYTIEEEARELFGDDVEKERAYLDSMGTELVYNIGIKEFTYQECKARELNLGLDLKGGMHVTLEVSVEELIQTMSNNSTDKTFRKALEVSKQKQKDSQKDFITLFHESFEEIDPNAKLAAIFSTRELSDRISWENTNEDVISVIRDEAEDAIDRTFKILRTRIDQFGVTQPTIQKQEGTGRIIVELPGVDNPQRVRKILQNVAKLEFWETYEQFEVIQYLEKANEVLSQKLSLDDTTKTDEDASDTNNVANDFFTIDKDDISNDIVGATKDTSASNNDTSASGGLSLMEKLDEDTSGSGDSIPGQQSFEDFAKDNPLYAVLNPAIYTDETGVQRYRSGPVIGYCLGRDTAKVNRYMNIDVVKAAFPKNMKFLWTADPIGTDKPVYELLAIKISRRDGKAPLEGDAITDARQDFGFETGRAEISMSMNSEGARIWKRLTAEASKDENNKKCIAVVLDNLVRSYPVVQGEIPNGRSSITGNFEVEEAKDIANILKAGKLPAPARIVQEAIVGPSLGQESIDMGLMSLIAGFILVFGFMIFYYNIGGFVANLALMVNIFFIIGVLASLGAALTLPGIAGIVLTIGMSVDANVLIFERIREEITAGKGLRMAVIDGYKKAYSSIIDANVTTLLTGIILYT
ncbi:MAG: protein translocase subunit SecD, partial [Bacteroidia bacterium]|nr:protein translocase subunit SecD [Bacteroidia bacterium]